MAKKSHSSAHGFATAQHELLQLMGVAFAISAVNLCVLVEAVFIVSCSLQECLVREEAARSAVDRRS